MAKNDNNNYMDNQDMDNPQDGTESRQDSQQDDTGLKGGSVGGENVRDYLNGLDFPASRDEVVDHVMSQGASEMVIITLASIPDQDFQSPEEINQALSRDSEGNGL